MSAFALLLASASMLFSAVLYSRIQHQRENNIRENCQQTNERHDDVIGALDKLIAESPPSRRRRAEMSRAGTVFLLEAMFPHRDCEQLARRQVHTPP